MTDPVGGERSGLGIASIIVAVFLFSITDATAKWLGHAGYDSAQIVFLRYSIGLGPVALVVWLSGPAALKTGRPFAHAARGALICMAIWTFFTGLKHLPLAEAIAVAFTAPLFITALSRPLLGEAVGPRRWMAVGVGFLGALVMLRPGTAAFRGEALLILVSAFAFALAMLLTRRMAATETNAAMFAYTTIAASLISLPFAVQVWRAPAIDHYWVFGMIALFGSMAAYLMIQAYRHAPAAVVAPFEYTALLWGSLIGWVLWQERPDLFVWLGAAIVILSGVYITHREARSARARLQERTAKP